MTDPTTARDQLFKAMAGGWSLTQAEAASLREVIDAGLATHAHELAEQIRQTQCAPGVDICACCSLAADRIDPEAQR